MKRRGDASIILIVALALGWGAALVLNHNHNKSAKRMQVNPPEYRVQVEKIISETAALCVRHGYARPHSIRIVSIKRGERLIRNQWCFWWKPRHGNAGWYRGGLDNRTALIVCNPNTGDMDVRAMREETAHSILVACGIKDTEQQHRIMKEELRIKP